MELVNVNGVSTVRAKVATSILKLGIIIDQPLLAKADIEAIKFKLVEAGNGSEVAIHSVSLWTCLEESAERGGTFMLEPTVLKGTIDLTVDEMPYNAMDTNFLQVELAGVNVAMNVRLYAIDGWGNDGALRKLELKSIIGSAVSDVNLLGASRAIIPVGKIDSITIEYPEFESLKAKSITYGEEELELIQLELDGIVYLKGKTAIPRYLFENNWIIKCNSAIRMKVQPKDGAGDFNILLDK
ncbi:MAG: hypothetical protein COA58_02915 [Bacteroidetes bacterium]|nr:MAG: hypothetical protein COA58_02915 [Bacteroidota bacterium]